MGRYYSCSPQSLPSRVSKSADRLAFSPCHYRVPGYPGTRPGMALPGYRVHVCHARKGEEREVRSPGRKHQKGSVYAVVHCC
eukprot:178497-Rhodomonas_salina.2